MSSINTNVAAKVALQTLTQTQKSMVRVESRISTGYRVQEAQDNAAYWSIGTTMRSDATAMSAVKHAFPDVKFTLYRPRRAPPFVEELYGLAGPLLSARITLPFPLSEFPDDATVIDIGNHLFWPDFAALPMIDFFLGALGVDASSVPSSQKANRWLAGTSLPALPARA